MSYGNCFCKKEVKKDNQPLNFLKSLLIDMLQLVKIVLLLISCFLPIAYLEHFPEYSGEGKIKLFECTKNEKDSNLECLYFNLME